MGVFGCMTSCVRLNQWRLVPGEQEIEVLLLRRKEESYFPDQGQGRIRNKTPATD